MQPQISFILLLIALTLPCENYQTSKTIRTGSAVIFTDLLNSNNLPLTFNITYSQPIIQLTVLQGRLALFTYSAYTSTAFTFKLSLLQIQATYLIGSISDIGTSYFTKMTIQYITLPKSSTSYTITSNCYTTPNLLSGTSLRVQNISVINNYVPSTNVSIGAAISGCKINNIYDQSFLLSVKNFVNQSHFRYQIATQGSNTIDYICLVTFIVNLDSSEVQTYQIFPEIATNHLLKQENISQLQKIEPSARYTGNNRYFYGLNLLEVELQQINFEFQIDLNDINNSNISQNIIRLQYTAFYFAENSCTNTQYYNRFTETCQTSCPQIVVDKYCQQCHAQCNLCNGIKRSNCINCITGLSEFLGSCLCAVKSGKTENLTCQLCSEVIIGCQTCQYITQCTACTSQFDLNNVTKMCQCKNQYFLTESKCISYPGCIDIDNSTFDPLLQQCLKCNQSVYFMLNNKSNCECMDGFTLKQNTCQAICGDGILSGNQCDDNNTENTDGCSNICTIQSNYYCYQMTDTNLSYCVKSYNLSASVLYIKRILYSNSAEIVLELNQSIPIKTEQSIISNITTTIPLKSSSFSYNNNDKRLFFLIEYSTNIENNIYNIQINFNQKIIKNSIKLEIKIISINYKLTYDDNIILMQSIKYCYIILSTIVFLIALIASLINQKLIGLQLLLPVQIIFFSSLYIKNNNCINSTLIGLEYIKIYNAIISYDFIRLSTLNDHTIIKIQQEAQFLLNYNVLFALHVFFIILIFILNLFQKYFNIQPQNQQPKQQKVRIKRMKTIKNIKQWIINKIYLFLVASIMLQANFSIMLEFIFLHTDPSVIVIPNQINLTASLLAQGLIIGSFIYFHDDYVNFKVISYHSWNPKYGLYFVLYFFIFGYILCSLYDVQGGIFIVFLGSIIPIILILFLRPYSGQLINICGAIYCQLIMCISILYYGLTNFITIDANKSIYGVIFILLLIFIAIIVTIVRLIWITSCCKKNKKNRFQTLQEFQDNVDLQFLSSSNSARQNMLKGIKISNRSKQQIINQLQLENKSNDNQSQDNIIRYQQISEKTKENSKQEPNNTPMTQLEILKKRLRKQSKIKWG